MTVAAAGAAKPFYALLKQHAVVAAVTARSRACQCRALMSTKTAREFRHIGCRISELVQISEAKQ